ncbi:MAG: hypothetical protein KatS3mg100_063 [Candidatus Parcubacteria bacterium]|nr:MAG: hypothetical protein KatS3mg100_063 [Candidatus Parcubacteria bacterium]
MRQEANLDQDIARVMRRVNRLRVAQAVARLPFGAAFAIAASLIWLARAVSWWDVWRNFSAVSRLRDAGLFVVSAFAHTEIGVIVALAILAASVGRLVWWGWAQHRCAVVLSRKARPLYG